MTWDGTDRRQRSDFEREMIEFASEMRTHMRNQAQICQLHSNDIKALDTRMTRTEQAIQYQPEAPTIGQRAESLEQDREYAKGALKTIGIGLPTLASIGWAMFELWKYNR